MAGQKPARQPPVQKTALGLGSLGFAHTLLQALRTAMTAAVQFFLTFNFLVSHGSLRGQTTLIVEQFHFEIALTATRAGARCKGINAASAQTIALLSAEAGVP